MKRLINPSKYIKGLRPIRQVNWRHRRAYSATIRAAARAARDCGEVWICRSSYRTYSEQTALYAAHLNGTGNLAAVPGTSRHEKGNALDLGDAHDFNIGTNDKAKKALIKHGFVFAVPSESWHVEYRG